MDWNLREFKHYPRPGCGEQFETLETIWSNHWSGALCKGMDGMCLCLDLKRCVREAPLFKWRITVAEAGCWVGGGGGGEEGGGGGGGFSKVVRGLKEVESWSGLVEAPRVKNMGWASGRETYSTCELLAIFNCLTCMVVCRMTVTQQGDAHVQCTHTADQDPSLSLGAMDLLWFAIVVRIWIVLNCFGLHDTATG